MERYYVIAYKESSGKWTPWACCWEQHPLETMFHNEKLETGDAVIFKFYSPSGGDGYCDFLRKRV